jgi:hypothetical protein
MRKRSDDWLDAIFVIRMSWQASGVYSNGKSASMLLEHGRAFDPVPEPFGRLSVSTVELLLTRKRCRVADF